MHVGKRHMCAQLIVSSAYGGWVLQHGLLQLQSDGNCLAMHHTGHVFCSHLRSVVWTCPCGAHLKYGACIVQFLPYMGCKELQAPAEVSSVVLRCQACLRGSRQSNRTVLLGGSCVSQGQWARCYLQCFSLPTCVWMCRAPRSRIGAS